MKFNTSQKKDIEKYNYKWKVKWNINIFHYENINLNKLNHMN
jgi:hypothetical protein